MFDNTFTLSKISAKNFSNCLAWSSISYFRIKILLFSLLEFEKYERGTFFKMKLHVEGLQGGGGVVGIARAGGILRGENLER